MNYKIPYAVFCLAELKKWVAECEAAFKCDASEIMVMPEPGGDWDHYVSDERSSEDSFWTADGTVELTAAKRTVK